jgi:hypothetical protein
MGNGSRRNRVISCSHFRGTSPINHHSPVLEQYISIVIQIFSFKYIPTDISAHLMQVRHRKHQYVACEEGAVALPLDPSFTFNHKYYSNIHGLWRRHTRGFIKKNNVMWNCSCKGKAVPVHVTKPFWGTRGIPPLILNLGPRWKLSGENHVLAFLSPDKNSGIHWLGGRVGSRASLDVSENRQFAFFLPGWKYSPIRPVA